MLFQWQGACRTTPGHGHNINTNSVSAIISGKQLAAMQDDQGLLMFRIFFQRHAAGWLSWQQSMLCWLPPARGVGEGGPPLGPTASFCHQHGRYDIHPPVLLYPNIPCMKMPCVMSCVFTSHNTSLTTSCMPGVRLWHAPANSRIL